LIVLDVMMPKIDGIALLPMLRRVTEAPVIMLSARGEIEDRVEGLARGADDYLNKPFEIAELLAHVEAKLRRPRLEARSVLTYEDLSVDLGERTSRVARRRSIFPPRVRLLVALMRRPKRVFTREELLALYGAGRATPRRTSSSVTSRICARRSTMASRTRSSRPCVAPDTRFVPADRRFAGFSRRLTRDTFFSRSS